MARARSARRGGTDDVDATVPSLGEDDGVARHAPPGAGAVGRAVRDEELAVDDVKDLGGRTLGDDVRPRRGGPRADGDAADVDGRTTDEEKPDLWLFSSQDFGPSRGAEIGRESVGAEALGRGRAGIANRCANGTGCSSLDGFCSRRQSFAHC